MLSPEYIRTMCNRLRRVAQDFEDDLLVVIITGLLALNETSELAVAEIAEKVTQVTEVYQLRGYQEIRKIILDAIRETVTTELKVIEETAETAPEATEMPQERVLERELGNLPPEPESTQYEPKMPENGEEIPEIEPEVPKPELFPRGKYNWGDPYFWKVVDHTYRVTYGTWENITETQAYDAVTEYVDAADRAFVKTALGASWQDARREELERLEEQGVTTVTSDTGRTEHTDSAMERNLRTAISRMAGDITLEMMYKNGITLVLVSAHLGARPTHEVWQGKVYSINGDTSKYPDFWEATGYGTMLGLCGINCRHSFGAFVEGMHNPYEGKNFDDPQRYKDEQRQRELERRIRKLRRLKKALETEYKETKDKELKERLRQVRERLREAVAEYEQFCAEHDFRPLWERTRD